VSRPSSSTFPRDHDRSVSPPLATLKPTKCMPLATLGRGAGEKTFSSRPSPLATLKPTKCMPLATLGKGAEESQRCVSSRVPGTFLVTVIFASRHRHLRISSPSSTKSTSRGRAFSGASLSFLHLYFFSQQQQQHLPFHDLRPRLFRCPPVFYLSPPFLLPYAFHIDLPPWQRTISASLAAIIRVCSQGFLLLQPGAVTFQFPALLQRFFSGGCHLQFSWIHPRLTLNIVEACLLPTYSTAHFSSHSWIHPRLTLNIVD